MAAVRLILSKPKLLEYPTVLGTNYILNKSSYCTSSKSNFAEFFKKQTEISKSFEEKEPTPEPPKSFPTLLRNSKFVDLGPLKLKLLTGTIFHVVDDDLYIDFGWKFHTVCPRPMKNPELYFKGTKVKLLVKNFEISSKFLGSTRELTINEADCVLLGIVKSDISSDRNKFSDF